LRRDDPADESLRRMARDPSDEYPLTQIGKWRRDLAIRAGHPRHGVAAGTTITAYERGRPRGIATRQSHGDRAALPIVGNGSELEARRDQDNNESGD